jgi:hypothetical protein
MGFILEGKLWKSGSSLLKYKKPSLTTSES